MAKVTSEDLMAETEMTIEKPYIHHMIRSIAKTGVPIGDSDPVTVVDFEVGNWIADGYTLLQTHYLGEDQTAWMVMYILVRNI